MTRLAPSAINGRTEKGSLFADLDGVRRRHAAILAPNWRGRALTAVIAAALAGLFLWGLVVLEFSWLRIWNGLDQLGSFVKLMWPPQYGTEEKLRSYLWAMAETLSIAFLGTLLAAIIALPLSLVAARNVMTSRMIQFLARRSFDTIRGVDTLIWALIWINVVGLGPFAGILAIMTSDLAVFGKLFSEAIENADNKPVEGVKSTGGTHAHAVRYGIMPQVTPVLISQVLYFFESNTRSATIIGIVGAGGIGLHLAEQIRILEWQHVAFLVLLILAAVAIIDVISTRLRFAIIGKRAT